MVDTVLLCFVFVFVKTLYGRVEYGINIIIYNLHIFIYNIFYIYKIYVI